MTSPAPVYLSNVRSGAIVQRQDDFRLAVVSRQGANAFPPYINFQVVCLRNGDTEFWPAETRVHILDPIKMAQECANSNARTDQARSLLAALMIQHDLMVARFYPSELDNVARMSFGFDLKNEYSCEGKPLQIMEVVLKEPQ